MDDWLRKQVSSVVGQLPKEEKSSLRNTQTLLGIEYLTAEVGDEITRQLAAAICRSGHDRRPGRESFPARSAGAVVLCKQTSTADSPRPARAHDSRIGRRTRGHLQRESNDSSFRCGSHAL